MPKFRHKMKGVFLSILISVVWFSNANALSKQDWVQPNSWVRTAQTESRPAPIDTETSEPISVNGNGNGHNSVHTIQLLYKKLVNFIIDPNKIMKDDSSGLYYRDFSIQLNEEQLNRLRREINVHDLDCLITEIIMQSKPGRIEEISKYLLTWTDFILIQWHRVADSRQLLITIIFGAIIGLWFLCRKYRWNSVLIAAISIPYGLFIIIDSECSRKKEVRYLAKKLTNAKDPCDLKSYGFWSFWFGDPSVDCQRHLLETTHSEIHCSAIELYNEFSHLFLYEPTLGFVRKIADLLAELKATHGVIILVILLLSIYAFMKIYIPNLFKYIISPMAWRKPGNTSNNASSTQPIENLTERFLELNINQFKLIESLVKNTMNSNNQTTASLPPSQVEVIQQLHINDEIIDTEICTNKDKSNMIENIENIPKRKESKDQLNVTEKTNDAETITGTTEITTTGDTIIATVDIDILSDILSSEITELKE